MLKALEEQERGDILKLIEAANLVAELEEMRNMTFFVPSKEAFQVNYHITDDIKQIFYYLNYYYYYLP